MTDPKVNKPVVIVDDLVAGYDHRAVVGPLSFSVGNGEIVALIGSNGAGKSTLIKALVGLVERMQGKVAFIDSDYAYIPETPWLYEELTLWEHLEIAGMSRGMSRKEFVIQTELLLKQFKLFEVRHHYPGGFSKGMRQKVLIMASILAQPGLYIIDEPFSGLDAWATIELLDWMRRERDKGASIILSTHVLDIAERICDRFMVINNGRAAAAGSFEDLQATAGMSGGLFEIFLELTKGS